MTTRPHRAELLSDLRIQRGVLEAEVAIVTQAVECELDPFEWLTASRVLNELEPQLSLLNIKIADLEILSGDLRRIHSL